VIDSALTLAVKGERIHVWSGGNVFRELETSQNVLTPGCMRIKAKYLHN